MPFCIHCGIQTGDSDRFCAHCGSGQEAVAPPPASAPNAVPPPPPIVAAPNPRLRPNVAALLCYIPSFGWLASVFFLTADAYRRNRYVHFHALQGLFLFVADLLVGTLFGITPKILLRPLAVPMFWFGHWSIASAVQMAVVVIQVVGIAKTAKGEPFHLPVLGDIAERSMV
jgi:uncharacterized membrane protein